MKFRSGTTALPTYNLHDQTRFYAGEPLREEEGGTLFRDREVDVQVNLAYQELWRRAKAQDMGWGVVFQYVTSVADQIWYTMPTTLDTNLIQVEVEEDGKNISSDDTAQPVKLTRGSLRQEWIEYQTGVLTDSQFWLLREGGSSEDRYGIIAPLTTAGGGAIRLTLEVEPTLMGEDSSEPRGIPSSHRELICLLAAESLRVAVDLDPTDVLRKVGRLYPEFIEDKGPRFGEDVDFQIPVAGRSTEQSFYTQTGFIRRGTD